MSRTSAAGARQRVGNDLQRHPYVHFGGERHDVLDAASRRGRLVVARRHLLHRRHAQVHDEESIGDVPRHLERRSRLGDRGRAPLVITRRVRERSDPSACLHAVENRRVHRVQREPCVGQPVGQPRNRLVVVIVEVRPRGEHLHGLETVRRDMHEVVAAQPGFVKEVRGNAVAGVRQTTILAGPRALPQASAGPEV